MFEIIGAMPGSADKQDDHKLNATLNITYRLARRIVIAVVGTTVLLLGVIMLVTPGPGLVIIPLGLAILSVEFAFARSWLKRIRRQISEHLAKTRSDSAERYR